MKQPVTSGVSDLFYWQTTATIASNAAGANKASTFLQVDGASFFVLCGFVGVTNYDAFAGDFIAVIGGGPAAARTLITPPFLPSHFDLMIRTNSEYQLMDEPVPQASICANGYRSGQGLPWPDLYAPQTRFDFDFFNVTPTIQLNGDGSAKPLMINFALMGYFVNTDYLASYLASFDAYQRVAQNSPAGWLSQFTGIDLTGVPNV